MYNRTAVLASVVGVAVLAFAGIGVFLTLSLSSPEDPYTPSQPDIEQNPGVEGEGEVPSASEENPGLYFTIMSHMESNFTDDTNEQLFLFHVNQLRWAMDLFDEYGVKLTVESEQPFARANTIWGVNILKEIVERGHGVGTHADFGLSPTEKNITVTGLTQKFMENKALVDALVGAEHNRGVSGGFSYVDWVLAASAAEFEYIDGVVGFGYLSMPLSARPEGWTDEYIRQNTYHDSIPLDFSDRMYSRFLADAQDLVPDEDGVLAMMGGGIGELASIAEGRSNCFPNCVFDMDDVDAVIAYIEEARALRDEDRAARVNIHIPLTLLKQQHEVPLRALLSALAEYADAGDIVLATQLESYEAFAGF